MVRAAVAAYQQGRDGMTGGTITHGDGSIVVRARPADLDGAAFGVLPQVPVKLRVLPSGYAHQFAYPDLSAGAHSVCHSASFVTSRASHVRSISSTRISHRLARSYGLHGNAALSATVLS